MTDPARTSRPTRISPVWLDLPAIAAFSQEVEDAFSGAELTYSQRLRLLRRASHFGIRRFDANLLIAMIQHRRPSPSQAATDSPASNRAKRRRLWPIAAAIAIQGIIIVLAWTALRVVM